MQINLEPHIDGLIFLDLTTGRRCMVSDSAGTPTLSYETDSWEWVRIRDVTEQDYAMIVAAYEEAHLLGDIPVETRLIE